MMLQIHIRLTLDALPVLARNDPVTEAVSQWAKILYFSQNFSYRKVASSRPVYYSKVTGLRPKVTVDKDQISPS